MAGSRSSGGRSSPEARAAARSRFASPSPPSSMPSSSAPVRPCEALFGPAEEPGRECEWRSPRASACEWICQWAVCWQGRDRKKQRVFSRETWLRGGSCLRDFKEINALLWAWYQGRRTRAHRSCMVIYKHVCSRKRGPFLFVRCSWRAAWALVGGQGAASGLLRVCCDISQAFASRTLLLNKHVRKIGTPQAISGQTAVS